MKAAPRPSESQFFAQDKDGALRRPAVSCQNSVTWRTPRRCLPTWRPMQTRFHTLEFEVGWT